MTCSEPIISMIFMDNDSESVPLLHITYLIIH